MPRTLSCALVRVPAPAQAVWLLVAAQLAARLSARGQHLWVFKSERDPELWLEFSEAGERAAHRAVAPRSPEEQVLEARLRELARYEPDPSVLWTEVPLSQEGGEAPPLHRRWRRVDRDALGPQHPVRARRVRPPLHPDDRGADRAGGALLPARRAGARA